MKNKKLVGVLIASCGALASTAHAQSGWQKNNKGHDVYVYKPEPDKPSEPPPAQEPGSSSSSSTPAPAPPSASAKPDFREGLARSGSPGHYGFIDESGQQVIQEAFEDATHFGEGLAAVASAGKWGFIDKTGRVVISYQFERADHFRQGRAAVQLGGKWGFIDQSGTLVIPAQYDEFQWFRKGPWRYEGSPGAVEDLASVAVQRKWGVIDKSGKLVLPLKYDEVRFDNSKGTITGYAGDTSSSPREPSSASKSDASEIPAEPPSPLRWEVGIFRVSPAAAAQKKSLGGLAALDLFGTSSDRTFSVAGQSSIALGYDSNGNIPFDAKAALGLGVKLGPVLFAPLLGVGMDTLRGGDSDVFKVPLEFYWDIEARLKLALGNSYSVDVEVLRANRVGILDHETRLGAHVGRRFGASTFWYLGFRFVDYEQAKLLGGSLGASF